MKFDTLPLLHHLASEYNQIISSADNASGTRSLPTVGDDNGLVLPDHDDESDIECELEEVENEMSMLLLLGLSTDDGQRITEPKVKKRRKKYDMRRLTFTNPHTGVRERYTFHHTLWYCNYITNPAPHNEKWNQLFRLRFRMPYSAFIDLLDQCSQSDRFATWVNTRIHKYNKQETTPLALLLLCVLRHLGRAWTLDDLAEATVVVGRQFANS